MKEVYDLFPTLVMRFTDVISPSELDNLFEKLKKCKSDENDAALVRGRSSYIKCFDILSKLGLKEKMQKRVDEYADHIKLKPLNISNSWFAIQDVGGMLKDHSHGGSIVSGVFYINVDEGSNPTVFENPNPYAYFNYDTVIKEYTPYTYQHFNVFPQKGNLIIFPSWVKHGCTYIPNQSKDRTIISFNTKCKLE